MTQVPAARPLFGRRVVVTRAAEQADDLAALLEAVGAVPVVVPLIEIVTVAEEVARLAADDPDSFDWLVVTSPNGARQYAATHGGAAPRNVAAVGTATSAALVEAGVTATLVPAQQRAAGLLAELPAPAPGGTGSILLVQALDAEPELADGLTETGWNVTVRTPYRSLPARPSAGMQLAALAADAVLFASGSAARSWAAVFGDSSPPVVVAIGPQTARAVTDAGLKVSVVATDHSLSGLVVALERHLAGNE